GAARRRPPVRLLTIRGVVRSSVRLHAVRRTVHRGRNSATERDRGDRNGGADNRENERVFGGRSTRVIAQHVDESLHVTIPSLGSHTPPQERRTRRGPPEDGPLYSNYWQFELYEAAVFDFTQFEARFMAVATAPPSVIAAIAMAAPIIARMSAYSAAEAPESSRSMLMKVFMLPFLLSKCPRALPGCGLTLAVALIGEETKTPRHLPMETELKRHVAGAPERSAAFGL